ncbi:MAG: serine/threonine-protein kinase, partial [Candidatus Binatia bacterium]
SPEEAAMVGITASGEIDTIGRYRVLRRLDAEHATSAYLAEAPNSRRRVVLHVTIDPPGDKAVLDRFLREAEVARRLSHPNLVAVLGLEEDPAFGAFLVTELVEGLSLPECIRRGTLDPEQRFSVLIHVLRALEAAHAAGIVHGELRPSKVLVAQDGTAKVRGFAGAADGPGRPVGIGADWGHLAPERIAGMQPGVAADEYGFAVIAFELLTGQLPYAEPYLSDPEADAAAVGTNALEGLSPPLRAVFERALATDPSQRFPSPRIFLTELLAASSLDDAVRRRLLADLPLVVPAAGPRLGRGRVGYRGAAAFAVFGVAAAVTGFVVGERLVPAVPEPAPLRVVEVDSTPAGATVFVDGASIGETPRRAFVAADAQRLRVEKEGYRPVDLVLDGDREPLELRVAMEPSELLRTARVRPKPPVARAPRRAATAPVPAPRGDDSAGGLIPFVADWINGSR